MLIFSAFIFRGGRGHALTDTFTVSGSWQVPTGVTSAIMEVWGGGGGGASTTVTTSGGGGGGGGGYAKKTLTVSTGDTYTVTVGNGGTGGSNGNQGSTGIESSVTNPSSVRVVAAGGGESGKNSQTAICPYCGGNGGNGNIGDVFHSGGIGADGSGISSTSGAGAGAAGSTGAGGNANGTTAGTGTSLNGGNGGTGVTGSNNGNPGNNYGGGASGSSRNSATTNTGGDGAPGLVTITYTAVNSAPSVPALILPASGVTKVPNNNVVFQLRSSDPENDYLMYHIKVYSTQSECTSDSATNLTRSIDQTSSQSGWSGQNQQTNTAYTGSSTISNSTIATYTYQSPFLTPDTTYWWKARATDPSGSNSWSSWATCQSFASTTYTLNIQGGANIRGGTKLGN